MKRDEDLSYEARQLLMLEATILLGGIELLALEERIGNVNTGLDEESAEKCVQVDIFISPDITSGYVP
ncbi:hypothetical protein L7F22_040537 [Adiantum nelumboides]|nr:hypothetical protein [Adiantum nelumboides]